MGELLGAYPPKQGSKPPKLKHETINQLKFCQFLECQAPPHKPNPPYWKLSGDGSGLNNGVPQGSVLASLFFNIYTSDLPTTVSWKYAYADELAIINDVSESFLSSQSHKPFESE